VETILLYDLLSLVNLPNLLLCIQTIVLCFEDIQCHRPKTTPINVEPRYDTIVGPYRGAITGVDRHIIERTTIQVKMIPHLHSKL
jgi:hypothetical protein